MNNYFKGYDLSAIQGNVPWQALANEGTKFIIAKCYEGNKGQDPFYTKNIQGAKSVGILTMGYHFAYPLPEITSQPTRSPVWQAQTHFKASAGELCALDLEWPLTPDWQKWGCSAAQIVDWTLKYLEEYERLSGIKIPVYTFPNYMQVLGHPAQLANYPLWIASYQSTPLIPKPWNDWVLWQSSGGTEHMPNGVPADVDWVKDLSLWSVHTPAAPSSSNQVPEVNTSTADHASSTPAPTSVFPPPAPPTPVQQISVPGGSNSVLNFFSNLLKSLLHI